MNIINIKQTTDILVSFEQLKRRSNRFYEEINQTSQLLERLSGMHQVHRKLEYILEEVQEESYLLDQMNKCLEQTCISYSRCEEGIAELAEEAANGRFRNLVFRISEIPPWVFTLLR